MPSEFHLFILKKSHDDLLPGLYSLEETWPVLRTTDLSDPALDLNGSDISAYDWGTQTLVFTASASQRFAEVFVGSDAGLSVIEKCFVVTFNGERRYGGIFEFPGSELRIQFPVIYVKAAQGLVSFVLRPSHETRIDDFASFPPELKARIEIPEIRDYFATLGTLIP